jgi:2-polyprenyl-3-methyl-5-hydroxy-6-metoxy-1,4-benzoquinol methylase
MNNNLINYLKHKNIYLIGPAESNFDISTIPDDENNVIVVINRFNDYNNYIKLKDYKNIILFHSFYTHKPVLQDFLYVISTYPLFGGIRLDQIDKELLNSECCFNNNNNIIFKDSIIDFKSNQLNSMFTSIDLQLYTELCELLDFDRPTSGMIVLYFFIKNINIINKLNIIGMSLGLTKYQDDYIKPHISEVINSIHNINKEQLEFKKLYIKYKDKIFIENKKFNEYLNINKLEYFWNNCNTAFSHITINQHLGNYNKLTNFWENNFINKIDFKQKKILDYGIGGAYLGKYLLENKEINMYYGIDISIRSLEQAKYILKDYNNVKLFHCQEFYESFNTNLDIIICQACIQHFPDKDYLIKFLQKINTLDSKLIMLQIAYNKDTIFNDSTYKTMDDVVRSCYTNDMFISLYLKDYRVKYKSEIAVNDYQFLIFERN